MCTFAADKLRAGACGNQDCLADMRLLHMDRNRNFFQMHADKSTADVEAGVRLDMLDGDCMFKGSVAGRCERATSLGLRNHVHDFSAWDCGMFNDNRTVQVFAALRCNVDAQRLENRL